MNKAFVFPEAEIWVKPAGLNSQSVGFASFYSLERTPILVEDGSAAIYDETLTLRSPWVTSEVTTIFDAAGPFDVDIRWRNEDDGRLESAAVRSAGMRRAERRPGVGGVEEFSFEFVTKALTK